MPITVAQILERKFGEKASTGVAEGFGGGSPFAAGAKAETTADKRKKEEAKKKGRKKGGRGRNEALELIGEAKRPKLSRKEKEWAKGVMSRGTVHGAEPLPPPIRGMEGPFRYKSGRVLYYDNREGKYYDRGQDMYLSTKDAEKAIMSDVADDGDGIDEVAGENSATFSPGNREIDGSGDWWVVDRDTGQRYVAGLPNRDAAEAWCIERNVPCLTAAETHRVISGDPVANAFAREHPDTIFASRPNGYGV